MMISLLAVVEKKWKDARTRTMGQENRQDQDAIHQTRPQMPISPAHNSLIDCWFRQLSLMSLVLHAYVFCRVRSDQDEQIKY
jgi:hypothetical protein